MAFFGQRAYPLTASRHQAIQPHRVPLAAGCAYSAERWRITRCKAATDDSEEQSGPSGWATDNIASGQLYAGSVYSHNLPWKGFTRMMFMAIEAEADSKQEIREAHDSCNQPHNSSSSCSSDTSKLSALEEEESSDDEHYIVGAGSSSGSFHINIQPTSPLPPSTDFSKKLQKAMEAHGDAERLREAAEDEAQRFFAAISAASRTPYQARHPQEPTPAPVDIEAAIQQGIQLARDQFIIALWLARSLLQHTQRALAICAHKIRLEMSMQPADSAARERHTAALQQLQDLTEETMGDLAATLMRQFLPGCNLSTAEAREWLEELWLLEVPGDKDSEPDGNC